METHAPLKARISSRTRQENHLLSLNSTIARETKRAVAAERAGDWRKADGHRQLAESIASFKKVSIEKDAEFAEKAKKETLPPLPVNYVPKGVPVSELTDHQRHIMKLEQNIESYRQRADRLGVEGEYSEDVAMMHALSDFRESSIRNELGLKSKRGASSASSSGAGLTWAWALMAFAVIFPIFMGIIAG